MSNKILDSMKDMLFNIQHGSEIQKTRDYEKQITSSAIGLAAMYTAGSAFVSVHAAYYMNRNPKSDLLNATIEGFKSISKNGVFPASDHWFAIKYFPGIYGQLLFVGGLFILAYYLTSKKNAKDPDAQGGGGWNKDFAGFKRSFEEPKFYKNIIFSKQLFFSMNGKKTKRNNNVLVIGGSGTGKSVGIIKPNILQAYGSYVITDPKGELLAAEGKYLENKGYKVKVFNLSDMRHSHNYNPLKYVEKDEDVMALVDAYILNQAKGGSSSDSFWDSATTLLMQAIIFYMLEMEKLNKFDPRERNFNTLYHYINQAKMEEENKQKGQDDTPQETICGKVPINDLDKKFLQLMELYGGESSTGAQHSHALNLWNSFKSGNEKTLASVLITSVTKLQAFELDGIASLTATDNIGLDKISEEKSALFIIVPSGSTTFNFLAAMMYTQLFNLMYRRSEEKTASELWLQHKESGETLAILSGREKGVRPSVERAERFKRYISKATPIKTQMGYMIKIREYDFEKTYEVTNKGMPDFKKSEELMKQYIEDIKNSVIASEECRVPVPVRFLLDEFANIGIIPNFVERLSTMRSYEMSCTIILQNMTQLEKNYKGETNTFVGNCSTFVFLGAQDKETNQYMETMLGKETVAGASYSFSVGGKGGGSESRNQVGKSTMSMSDLITKDNDKCIIMIQGLKPYFCDKYHMWEHPEYKLSGDGNKSLAYNYKEEIANVLVQYELDNLNRSIEHQRENPGQKNDDSDVKPTSPLWNLFPPESDKYPAPMPVTKPTSTPKTKDTPKNDTSDAASDAEAKAEEARRKKEEARQKQEELAAQEAEKEEREKQDEREEREAEGEGEQMEEVPGVADEVPDAGEEPDYGDTDLSDFI